MRYIFGALFWLWQIVAVVVMVGAFANLNNCMKGNSVCEVSDGTIIVFWGFVWMVFSVIFGLMFNFTRKVR